MKKKLGLALIGLLACTLSASAISITINEDSATRLDFTVLWGSWVADEFALPNGTSIAVPSVLLTGNRFSAVRMVENVGTPLALLLSPAPGPGVPSFFSFTDVGGGSPRVFDGVLASLSGPLPDFAHAVPGVAYGARFIYGQDISTGVPDGGSTLMLLAGALGTLGWFQRRFRPALHT